MSYGMDKESGFNSVLEAMGKDATEDATQAVRLLKANHQRSLQLGYPGEHLRDVIKTMGSWT